VIEIEGEQVIDMQDFGLKPPRILMFKVEPRVRVRARVVAEREAPQGRGGAEGISASGNTS
jgi:hypothetical protein